MKKKIYVYFKRNKRDDKKATKRINSNEEKKVKRKGEKKLLHIRAEFFFSPSLSFLCPFLCCERRENKEKQEF